jgi:hypothetical protein
MDCAWFLDALQCLIFLTVSRSKRFLFFYIYRAMRQLHVPYFNICTVYAATGDLAGEENTGSLKYVNNNMCSFLQTNGAARDREAAIKADAAIPLKCRSSADILRFLRRGMGLIRTYCCFYRSTEENQSERISSGS